jgi:NADH dehydrogenase FAD-containing subunit
LADRFDREIAAKTVSIKAVFPETLDKALAGSGLFRNIEGSFAEKGIELVSDFRIDRVEKGRLLGSGAASIDFDLLMLMPPFSGQSPVQHLYSEEETDGFARVDLKMQVSGFPGIYAAGDITNYPGKLKLIATGAGEACIAVNNAVHWINPKAKVNPGHSSNMALFGQKDD